MTGNGSPSRLTLVLTNRCNMNCSYCYQRAREPASMSWDAARAGVDLALSMPGRVVELTFYGGEPLLEFELIRRAVEYASDSLAAGRRIRYWVVTNGTLIDDEVSDFLALHKVMTQVSFDGVPEAQSLRGRGTFEKLDRALDLMRDAHPDHFERHTEVCITAPPETVPYMADSVDYFLGKGTREIDLSPVITPSPGWSDDLVGELEKQFARILASSLTHLEQTRRIPFKLYSGEGLLTGPPITNRAMCEVVAGNSLAVDVDGTVSGCVLFAPSIQAYESELLRECHPVMVLGNVSDPDAGARMAAFPDEARTLPIISEKEKKYSSYRRCADCRFFAACVTCPTSIGFAEGNADPHRVPDYYCAFNYTALASRDGFPVQPTDLEVVRGDRFKELRLKWKRIGEEARREAKEPSTAAPTGAAP